MKKVKDKDKWMDDGEKLSKGSFKTVEDCCSSPEEKGTVK